jgi:hypothetical protein
MANRHSTPFRRNDANSLRRFFNGHRTRCRSQTSAKVDFSRRANLAVGAIPLIIAAGNADLKIGDFEINNFGLGALSAIILWRILRPGHFAEGGDTGKNIFEPEAVVVDA